KAHISVFGWESVTNAALTSAMRPMLHAPLNNAVPVVTSIIPRQVRQMNLNKFMCQSFSGWGRCRHRFGQTFFDLFGEEFNIRLNENIFVRARNVFHAHAAARELAPAEILRV